MELVEHVPSPAALLAAAARLLRPGGDLFISTINRNLRSFLLAIVGAEYLLRLIPRGTHEYARLLRPAELARLARAERLTLCDVTA
jgi:2-polyprenyl-6-hydroxyphenyl methylase/3-demethylubiquinone-9 3-methyltransferase